MQLNDQTFCKELFWQMSLSFNCLGTGGVNYMSRNEIIIDIRVYVDIL